MKDLVYTILREQFHNSECCDVFQLDDYITLDFLEYDSRHVIKVFLKPISQYYKNSKSGLHADISEYEKDIYTTDLDRRLHSLIEDALKDNFPSIYLYAEGIEETVQTNQRLENLISINFKTRKRIA